MLCTPKSRILARSHAYLTVGQANLTVKMGCSHCEQCWEVERSADVRKEGWKNRQSSIQAQLHPYLLHDDGGNGSSDPHSL